MLQGPQRCGATRRISVPKKRREFGASALPLGSAHTHSTEDPGHLLHAGKYSEDWVEVGQLGYLLVVVLCYHCLWGFFQVFHCFPSHFIITGIVAIIVPKHSGFQFCQALRNTLNLKGTTWQNGFCTISAIPQVWTSPLANLNKHFRTPSHYSLWKHWLLAL